MSSDSDFVKNLERFAAIAIQISCREFFVTRWTNLSLSLSLSSYGRRQRIVKFLNLRGHVLIEELHNS